MGQVSNNNSRYDAFPQRQQLFDPSKVVAFGLNNYTAMLLRPDALAPKIADGASARYGCQRRLIETMQGNLLSLRGFELGPAAFRLFGEKQQVDAYYPELRIDGVSYYAHATTPFNKLGDIQERAVQVVTGPCLFGTNSTEAILHDGRRVSLTDPFIKPIDYPVAQLQLNQRLSLYEIEFIYRMGSFLGRYARENPNVDKVFLNMPKYEYYTYPLQAYNLGLMPKELMQAWMAAVDARSNAMAKLYSRAVTAVSGRSDLAFQELTPMEALGQEIRRRAADGTRVTYPEAKEILEQDARFGGLWSAALKEICEKGAKEDPMKSLPHASYAVAELFAAQSSQERKVIGLPVEDATEERIMGSAHKVLSGQLAQQEKSYRLAGIHVQSSLVPRVSFTARGGHTRLYFLDDYNPTEQTERMLAEYYRIPRIGLVGDGLKDLLR